MENNVRSTENRNVWVTHRTSDPTGLIQFRVSLKRNGGTVPDRKSPEQNPEANADNEEEEGGEAKKKDSIDLNDASVSIKIDWQQRIFSPEEVRKAVDGHAICENPSLSAKYQTAIQKKRDENPNYNGSEVYTKVAEDRYVDPSEIDIPFFGNIGERDPNELAEAVLLGQGHEEMIEVVRCNAQSMHIFASIPCSNGVIHNELLAVVRAYPGGRIDVRPPFSNKQSVPTQYKFFTPTKEVVTYVFDVIENSVENETPFEHTLLSDIKRRRAIFEAGQNDCLLSQVPEPINAIRMFYRGEISFAYMNSAPGVAVEYHLKLPPGWSNDEPSLPLDGCSQYSLCDENGKACINLPIDLVARCQVQTSPTLILTLHSFTPEAARIVEGYGSCCLPMEPGSHTLTVDLWRVRGRVSEELRLLFLDSGLEQQAVVEVADGDHEFGGISADIVYNKFGLRTIGAGKLILKFNLVMQSGLFGNRKAPQTGVSGLGSLSASHEASSRLTNMLSRMSEQNNNN